MNTLVRRVFLVLLCCMALLLGAPFATAQDSRGAITGIVSDSTGAVISGAKVAATGDATGVVTTATTNEHGNYALLYLDPGTYTVTAEHEGFKKLVQKNVQVTVGGEFKFDAKLSVGNVQTQVSVTEEAPRIETANADVGVTMTNQQIADLPLTDGNPFTLARLAPGTVFTGDPTLARPFDNANVSSLQVNGSSGAINYGLNGSPNSGHQLGHNNVLSFMPPADALFEFKMTTSGYSAQTGHTAGAGVNINTKSGTNKFHGTLYAQNRNEALAANNFFVNNLGEPKPIMRLNHYGGTIGGPVDIPKVYNGHSKTFFFFATDHMIDSFPSPAPTTVPTLGEKGLDASGHQLGYLDFGSACGTGFYSNGLCKDTSGGQLYNPFTATAPPNSTNVTRLPYLFNRIPLSDVNPVGLAIANFFPNPNTAGLPDGTNNYYSPNSRQDFFHSYMGRLDHFLSARQSLHANYQQNWRKEHRDNPFGVVTNPVLNVTMAPKGNDLFYTNYGGQLGDTITVSNSSVLDLRLGFSQFRDKRRPQVLGFDPATLGLSTSATDVIKQLTGVGNYMPYFNISGLGSVGNTNSRYEDDISNTGYVSATLNRMMGKHMLALGYEGRVIRENSANYGNPLGYYDFTQNYVEQYYNSSSEGGWQSLASLMLGLPYSNSSYLNLNDNSANQRLFHGAFIQDDWKVGSKVTLNLGVRWEIEGAPTERFNRNILGFDPTASSAASAAAASAFGPSTTGWVNGTFTPPPGACGVNNTCPAFTVSNSQFLGGLYYTNSNNRSFYQVSPYNFQPRFGVAFAPYSTTVIRGGVGLYSVPLNGASDNGSPGFNQIGFSQQTKAAYSTQTNGLNFFGLNTCNPSPCPQAGTIYNMFPATNQPGTNNGVVTPIGSTLGPETDWGQSIDISPLPVTGNPKIGRALSWSFDIQTELPGKWTVILAYAGRKAWHLEEDSNYLNAVPAQYYTHDPLNEADNMAMWNTALTSNGVKSASGPGVPSPNLPIGNPFKNLIGANNSYYATSNQTLAQMVRPFPQFGTITTGLYNAGSFYNGASILLDRKFANGYQVYFTYTRSKAMADNGFLNDFETTPQHHLDFNDAPNRIAATFVGQLPIGRGRKFANNLPRWIDGIIGGWQSGIVYQYQTGFPINLSSYDTYYNGDWNQIQLDYSANTIAHGVVYNVAGFYPYGGALCAKQATDSTLKGVCSSDAQINLSTYHYRTLPLDFGNLRNPGQNNWDINAVKKIRIKERFTYELRADFLNAFNHPWFNGPNNDPTSSSFGQITSQKNFPRTIQLGMKLVF